MTNLTFPEIAISALLLWFGAGAVFISCVNLYNYRLDKIGEQLKTDDFHSEWYAKSLLMRHKMRGAK